MRPKGWLSKWLQPTVQWLYLSQKKSVVSGCNRFYSDKLRNVYGVSSHALTLRLAMMLVYSRDLQMLHVAWQQSTAQVTSVIHVSNVKINLLFSSKTRLCGMLLCLRSYIIEKTTGSAVTLSIDTSYCAQCTLCKLIRSRST